MKILTPILLFLLCLQPDTLLAQSSPTPFELATGNYQMSGWAADNAAGTYPNNMIFHVHQTTSNPELTDEPDADWTCVYDLENRSRVLGLGADGFGFINTNTAQSTDDCGSLNVGRNVGAAVLALNTENRTNVEIDYTVGTVWTNFRTYYIRFQYRIGDSGSWSDFSTPVVYAVNDTGHSEQVSVQLPLEAENEAHVEVRWRYYQGTNSPSGRRPLLRVDNISVTSEAMQAALPEAIAIGNVNEGRNLTQDVAFSVTAFTVDSNEVQRSVNSPTNFEISVKEGSGTLSGTTTATVLSGDATIEFEELYYSGGGEQAVFEIEATGGMNLESTTTEPLFFLSRPDRISLQNYTGIAAVNQPLKAFEVLVLNENGIVIDGFNEEAQVHVIEGAGTLNGTFNKNFENGELVFDDWTADEVGMYRFEIRVPGVDTVIRNLEVIEDGLVQPSPYVLADSAYRFNFWNPEANPATYPESMIFHIHEGGDPDLGTDPTSTYTCAYNLDSRPRVNGLGDLGLSFINTTNPQNDESCILEGAYVSGAVLSLNTLNCRNISVDYIAGMVLGGNPNVNVPREYRLRLQYRIGTTQNFRMVPNSEEYSSAGKNEGHAQLFTGIELPEECEDKEEVQLRWLYYQHAANDEGRRPMLRLDDIEIRRDAETSRAEKELDLKIQLYPNPAQDYLMLEATPENEAVYQVQIISTSGQVVAQNRIFLGRGAVEVPTSQLPNGLYFIRLQDRSGAMLVKKFVKQN